MNFSEVREELNFSLHVGADADMTNKIGVSIDALDTKGLGIYGLNVKDDSGSAATLQRLQSLSSVLTKRLRCSCLHLHYLRAPAHAESSDML